MLALCTRCFYDHIGIVKNLCAVLELVDVPVIGHLSQTQDDVGLLYIGVADLLVADDNIGLRKGSARLGSIGGRHRRIEILIDRGRLPDNLSGRDQALPADAA